MKNKLLYIFAAIILTFSIVGCKKKPTDNPSNNKPPFEEPVKDPDAELIKDDPDATEFRVYFNYNDGTEYEMIHAILGQQITRPNERLRDGYIFEGWYKDKELTEEFIFSKEYILESIILYAKWEEFIHPDYTKVLDEYVPYETTTNLELPQQIEEYKGVYFIWSTSDEFTISSKGFVNQGREDIKVIVNLEVIDRGVHLFYSRECVVNKINFKPIREGKAMFGYYSTWFYDGYTAEELKLDVINVSFAYVKSDFSLDLSSINTNAFLEARKSGVRVVLSVQGAGDSSKNISDCAKTDEGRKKIAQNIADVIEKYHFDGVDIDWEYPGHFTPYNKAAEAENYKLLMKEIYEKVKSLNEDYLVTSAIPGGAEGFKRFDMKNTKSWQYLDYIHLMTYDMHASSKVYHHTALYSNVGKATATQASVNDSIEIFTLQGVPKEKLVIGLAFYGKYTYPANATNGGLGQNSKNGDEYKSINYTQIKSRFLSRLGNGVTYYFDSTCKAPYLYDSEANIFITYDNEESIKEKCKYAMTNGLPGIMIWEIGEDNTGDLMKAVLQGMRRN